VDAAADEGNVEPVVVAHELRTALAAAQHADVARVTANEDGHRHRVHVVTPLAAHTHKDCTWTAPPQTTDRLSFTVRFWKSRPSNNDHMAKCRGCSTDYPPHINDGTLTNIHTHTHTHTHTVTHTRDITRQPTIVRCRMSFWPSVLPEFILLFFGLAGFKSLSLSLQFSAAVDCRAGSEVQVSQKYWSSIFPALDPILFLRFQNGRLQVEMPHNDPSKLHTITNFVSKPMFLIMKNVLVYVEVIMEWQP